MCIVVCLVGVGWPCVRGQEPPSEAAAAKPQAEAGITPRHLIKRVDPVYPDDAKRDKVWGTVTMRATIEKDGSVTGVTVLSGNERLTQAAVDAVSQWKYDPYRANGEAIDMDTTLSVSFVLGAKDMNLVGAQANLPDEPSVVYPPSESVAPDEPAGTKPLGPVRVSGSVMAGMIVSKVDPTYPNSALAEVQGAVVLHAVIGKTGEITTLQVVSGPEVLRGAALDAVKQWKYRPYELKGEAVEVDTTITVMFMLNKPN
jgi:TonB family protein